MGNSIPKNLRQDSVFKPHWFDEDDWLCTVEFLPGNDLESRILGAEIIGYLLGYAHLTNTRTLAVAGDTRDDAYEILFSFASLEDKKMGS